MTIGYIFRHPVLAFNRRWVCAYWDHDPRGGTWVRNQYGVLTIDAVKHCTRCHEEVV